MSFAGTILTLLGIAALIIATCIAFMYYDNHESHVFLCAKRIRAIIVNALRRRRRVRRSRAARPVEPSVAPLYDPSAPPLYEVCNDMTSTNNTGASNHVSSIDTPAPPLDEESNDMTPTSNTGASHDASSIHPSAPPIYEECDDMTPTSNTGASNDASSSRFGTTNQGGQSINVSGATVVDEKGRPQNTYRPPSPRRHNRDDTDEAPPPAYDSLFD